MLFVLAQTAFPQQPPPATVLPVSARETRDRFHDLLLGNRTGDPPTGWALAHQLGPVAAPVLWDLLDREGSGAHRRWILVVACTLASPFDQVLQRLERAPADDRLLACLVAAQRPERPHIGEPAQFWSRIMGRERTVPAGLWIAACAVAARLGELPPQVPAFAEDDPGQLAAACLCGAADRSAPQWWSASPPRHAALVQRGELLGWARRARSGATVPAPVLRRATGLLDTPPSDRHEVLAAAALAVGAGGSIDRRWPAPEPALLAAFAGSPQGALAVSGWLRAVPHPRDEQPGRLAVAYAWSRSPQTVIDELAQWGDVAAVRGDICLALAWRLLTEPNGVRLPARPGIPQWFWVEFAAGAPLTVAAASGDARLDEAAQLALVGRLPRPAAAHAIEDALWRIGSHPHQYAWQQQRQLLAELLLAGSHAGIKFGGNQPLHERYLPRDQQPDSVLFEVAVACFDWFSRAGPGLPDELRLR